MSQLTFLPLDSPANPLASPGSAQASKMTVTSGRKLCALSKKPDPVGYLARTCLASSVWHSMTCWLRWNVRATPQRRLLYQLAPSTPHTDGIESGLWRTPSATDGDGGVMEMREGTADKYKLRDQIQAMNQRFWPTPKAQNANAPGIHGNGGQDLQTVVAIMNGLLPTPTVNGNYNRKGASAKSGDGLATAITHLLPTPRANSGVSRTPGTGGKCLQEEVRHLESKHGKLDPEFVEWLMGYPIGWSDCADSATP